MRRSDFEYSLPAELIAQAPLPQRSASRLLLLDGASGRCADHRFSELPTLLAPGDLLVFNDTRVVPARLSARRSSGGRVELLLERALAGHEALVQARASNRLRAGDELASAGGPVRLRARHGDLWQVLLPGPALEFFERFGQVPLPPYIARAPVDSDRERYQSRFARVPGAVAAPTASLHFDDELLAALRARGIGTAMLTLHVGAGTFQPLRSEQLDDDLLQRPVVFGENMPAEPFDDDRLRALEHLRRTDCAQIDLSRPCAISQLQPQAEQRFTHQLFHRRFAQARDPIRAHLQIRRRHQSLQDRQRRVVEHRLQFARRSGQEKEMR